MTAPDPRLGEIEGRPVAFHRLNRSQLLTLAIALQDQRDKALAQLRARDEKLARVEVLHVSTGGHNPLCHCGVEPGAAARCTECGDDYPCATLAAVAASTDPTP